MNADNCPLSDCQLKFSFVFMDVIKSFGNKIKDLRIQKGYSQEELANRAGIDRTYISDIEKGERNVSLKIIEKLAISFEMEIHELFTK